MYEVRQAGESIHQELCEDCGTFFHAFDAGRAAFTYTGVMRQSVFRIKYGGRREYLEYYGERMADLFEARVRRWEPEILIPVPMYWKKKNRRGFNQSEVLAGTLSKRWGFRCVPTRWPAAGIRRRRKAWTKGTAKQSQGSVPAFTQSASLENGSPDRRRIYHGQHAGRGGGASQRRRSREPVFLTLCTGKGKKAVCTEKNVWYT